MEQQNEMAKLQATIDQQTNITNTTETNTTARADADNKLRGELATRDAELKSRGMDDAQRQSLLDAHFKASAQALGWEERTPRYWHLPLVVGTDGRRLAKRHGDTRLSSYRRHGASAAQVLQLLARWCGMPQVEPNSAADLLGGFDLDRLPRQPIVFSAEDETWLGGK